MENTSTAAKRENVFKKFMNNDLSRTLIIFLLLCVALGIARPATFLTVSNVINVLSQISVNGIVVIGMTFILLTGGIDISTI